MPRDQVAGTDGAAEHDARGPGQQGDLWLSVLVPMFKVEEYLDECLRSVLDQADAGVEVVICDDGSPDGSATIAQSYVDRYPGQVRMIRHAQNRGISATRNSLLDAARGDYLWFVDSDDQVRAGAIAAIAEIVSIHSPDLIGCNYRKRRLPKSAFAGPQNCLITDRDTIVGGICASRKMYAWVRVARRELWADDLRFLGGRIFEDVALIPRLALRARSYLHISRPLLDYRIRPASILARIRTGSFDVQAHHELAGALDGFVDDLEREGEPFARTRFAVSHFIAMEFVKTVGRILRSAEPGIDGTGKGDLIAEFKALMERSSPIPFEALAGEYLRAGRLIAWMKLRRALALAGPPHSALQSS